MDYLKFKEKSFENLEVAQLCFDNKKYNACVNRSYYSMFQITASLLLKEINNYDKMGHGQVNAEFTQKYCNQQKIFPKFREYLTKARIRREIADYKDRLIKEKEAKKILTDAKEFVNTIYIVKLGD